MYVDIWIFGLFAILFGASAWWNRSSGITKGIEATLDMLVEKKIIMIVDDDVVAYSRKIPPARKSRSKKTLDN